MAVKSKIGTASIQFTPGKPKTTSIGLSKNSRPRRKGKKPYQGQGKR